jgi:hypothetical protein
MNAEISQPRSSAGPKADSIKASDLLILTVTALLLALPMLLYGPMVKGHDTYEHLNYSRHFSDQFWGGEWSPRWLLEMNHGLGSPSLFVYPPFASYVYSLLHPVSQVLRFDPFVAGEFLALWASGVFAFLWARTLAGRPIAHVSAALYMLMPYHLAVDFYRRNALSECWALAWMPLILYCAAKLMAGRRTAQFGLALAFAFLILSHFVSVLVFSLIPLLAVLTLSASGEGKRNMIRVAGAMALGTGLSSFYLLPAFSSAKYFPVLRLLRPPSFVLEDNLLSWDDVTILSSKVGFTHWVAVSALTTIAFLVLCSVVVFFVGSSSSRRLVIFWIAVCIVPVVMMTRLSWAVWSFSVPHYTLLLLRAVQYPWRLNIVLCLAAIPVGAVFFSELGRLARLSRNVALGLVSLFVLTGVISYAQVWRYYKNDVFVSNPLQLVNEDDGWFYAWATPGLDQASAFRATQGPRARFITGSGIADTLRWKARDIEFSSDSPNGGWVEVNQFYYPAWRAEAVGTSLPLETRAALPEGLVEVQVPPGRQKIHLQIPVQPAERAGRSISLASLLLFGFLATRKEANRFLGVSERSKKAYDSRESKEVTTA